VLDNLDILIILRLIHIINLKHKRFGTSTTSVAGGDIFRWSSDPNC